VGGGVARSWRVPKTYGETSGAPATQKSLSADEPLDHKKGLRFRDKEIKKKNVRRTERKNHSNKKHPL